MKNQVKHNFSKKKKKIRKFMQNITNRDMHIMNRLTNTAKWSITLISNQ